MSITFKDVKEAAGDTPLSIHSGESTPDGYFAVSFPFLGLFTTYLLTGKPQDENAPVVGRVEISDSRMRANVYRGAGLIGGEYMVAYSYDEAFAKILG
ncbi:MAG: hypothetical protein H9W81_13510 [Enterococcus sp.]|nr:hypothetical protein [Enterococcus sp.]